ncbi:hypothetical protein N7447_007894 [Penicillium robsamsonii]|uniref:uncharacterized protein n=1 Tax=Penicillium robsamsonii TaxID=1792511 RepID=UPI002549B665|nr:uncharacterized protein N7447_007894 [Penicillium robsamsonii]KAJ5817886.1 hypothetical protein N7447_007894 [Penicillium robsamsonii]
MSINVCANCGELFHACAALGGDPTLPSKLLGDLGTPKRWLRHMPCGLGAYTLQGKLLGKPLAREFSRRASTMNSTYGSPWSEV